jgi:ATP-binding protein involved in chromosome partitioning
MASKVDLEVLGVIENMSAFTGPDGERVAIFGEGGGQLLADELDVPLLAKVPLSSDLREHADEGTPLTVENPDAPAAQMIREAARGIVASTPLELPVMQAVPAGSTTAATDTAAGSNGGGVSGSALPMVQ